MSIKFENSIIHAFENLDISTFRVNLAIHHFFVCGGEVDITKQIPPSFRNRFLSYTLDNYRNIHDSIVLAEEFKDYFKENAYPDLLVFEDEIASISSLVIIFLESPGSLVELGMFCAKTNFYKKLVIVAPQEQTQSEDSFIYLGPLENIKKKEPTSVTVYPWPKADEPTYNNDHLLDLCEIIEQKLSKIPESMKFDKNNTGHVAHLIAEIVRISYPILISEIEYALAALDIDIFASQISRHIYLLEKLGLVRFYTYSRYKYYHPIKDLKSLVSFTTSRSFDVRKVSMSIQQSYILDDDSKSRKRRNAKIEINKLLDGATQ